MIKGLKASAAWIVRNANLLNYLAGRSLARRFNIQDLRYLFENRPVCCVGSGPSVDLVDFSHVQNSTVMLLNHAINFKDRFNASNSIVWFATDVYRIEQIIGSVPAEVPRIVMPHLYAKTAVIKRSLVQGDAYIHVRPGLRWSDLRNSQLKHHPLLRPISTPMTLPDFIPADRKSGASGLLPGTVMLNAMALAIGLGATRVVTFGFDLPASKGMLNTFGVRYADGIAPLHCSPGFDHGDILPILGMLRAECKTRGVPLYNCSPLTEEVIMEKRDIESIYV